MAPRVTTRPTHDLTLSDGVTTIGLTLANPRGEPDPLATREGSMPKTVMQTSQGDPDYGSLQLPYTTIVQKEWSGGRALLEFSKDSSRFYDSQGVDTRMGDMLLNGASVPSTGLTENYGVYAYNPNTVKQTGAGASAALAVRMPAQLVSISIRSLRISLRPYSGLPEAVSSLKAHIYADGATEPGVLLASSVTGHRVEIVPPGSYPEYEFPIGYTLPPGQRIWVVFWSSSPTSMGLEYKIDTSLTSVQRCHYIAGTWMADGTGSPTVTMSTGVKGSSLFFEYREQTYVVRSPDNNTGAKVFENGLRGFASANDDQLNTLKTDRNLVGWNLAGCYIRIVAGPGSTEERAWRKITSNTTGASGNQIWVEEPWLLPHTATTEFIIQGTNIWTEVLSLAPLRVTDVCVVDNLVYFATGDLNSVLRCYLNASLSWVLEWEGGTDGGNGTKASHLAVGTDAAGKRRVWRAVASTGEVSCADVVASGNMTFGTAIKCGTPRITNLLMYGNPQLPWVIKEDSFGSIVWNNTSSSGLYSEVPLHEMKNVRSELNGRAATSFDVYLFFSLLEGVERYIDNRLDDRGPNLDEGLPSIRRGPVTQLIAYPGGIFAQVDSGVAGQSSLLYWNQMGWHELLTTAAGVRLRGAGVQVIPGSQVDRLWYSTETDIAWIPISLNPLQQPGYQFTSSGYLITAWFKTAFAEVVKFWKSLTIYADNLSPVAFGNGVLVTAYYQTDDEGDGDAWHALPAIFDQSPSQRILLTSDYSLIGKRIRFKLVLSTLDPSLTPRVRAFNIEAVTRVPPAKAWTVTFLATSAMQDRQGRWEQVQEGQLRTQLETWSNSDERAAPILMRSEDPAMDNRRVFIDPASIVPLAITTEHNGIKRTKKAFSMNITGA